MTDTLNQISPRQFAVLRILRAIREVTEHIEELQENGSDPTRLFQSQIFVWLQRTREELVAAALYLEFRDDTMPPPGP